MPEIKKVQIVSTKFPPPCKIPDFDYPISAKENMKLVFEHKTPYWVPNVNYDMQTTAPKNDGERPAMLQSGLDWFGQTWEYVDVVGGHMITADSWRITDMSDWENQLKFPDLDRIDFSEGAEEAEKKLDRSKAVRYSMQNGMFERLLSLTNTMDAFCFLAAETESAKKYFNAMADFKIRLIDKLVKEWVPVDIVTISDDWGTQINSFISPDMYRELIYEPTKRICDHIRSKGMYPSLHSCGKIDNLVSQFVNLDIAFWEAQNNNDLEYVKENFGDRLNLRLVFDRPLMETPGVSDRDVSEAVEKFVTTLGKNGGLMANIWSPDPHVFTFTHKEMYRFSSEYYAKQWR